MFVQVRETITVSYRGKQMKEIQMIIYRPGIWADENPESLPTQIFGSV